LGRRHILGQWLCGYRGYRGYGARADVLVMFLNVSGIVDGRLK
jgi:hypothetical protein